MNKSSVALVVALLTLAFALGALMAGKAPMALAQDTSPANGQKPSERVASRDLAERPPVVAAVPFQSRTDYEQDPFEPGRLRRTDTTVTKLVLIRADGSTELKDAQ